jgi:hypothetical protein
VPLLREQFQAWTYGPVIPQVWSHFKSNPGELVHPVDKSNIVIFDDVLNEIRDVVDYFGRYSTFVISNATHNESPWVETRQDLSAGEHSNKIIPTIKIREYYAELLSDGEEAFSRHEALDVIPEPRLGYYYEAGICIRKMTRHPFYRMNLAEALHYPILFQSPPSIDGFEPPKRRAYIPAENL